MSRILLASAAGTLAVALLPLPAAAQKVSGPLTHRANEPVRIQMTITRQAGSMLAECELRYEGAAAVEVAQADLPWGNHYSTTFVAVTPQGSVLARSLPIDDPGPERTVIKPGSVMRGSIDVGLQFPSLKAESEIGEVIVFWTYRLDTDSDAVSNRVGGWLAFGSKR